LIQKKIELLRNKVEMRWTELASRLLLFFGHPTLAALQRVHQSNVHAQIRYVPPSVYPGRVHLFQANKQPLGTYKFDPQFGWGHWAAQGVEIHEFPGYHGTFMQEPYVAVFAQKLKECLRAAQQLRPEGGRQ
jgi:thioesterase domain-containing protein